MKSFLILFTLLLGIISALPAHALENDSKSDEAALENIDAIQALAIADQWRRAKRISIAT